MLIPIGFFGAGGAAGSYELISTAYGTGSSGTVSFTSIASTYKHLQLRVASKSTGGQVDLKLQFNADTGNNYGFHELRGNGSTVASSYGGSGIPAIELTAAMSVSTTANAHGVAIIDIADYASVSKNKTIRSFHGQKDTNQLIVLTSGLWSSTAAINRVDIIAKTLNFDATSRFSLYGIKG